MKRTVLVPFRTNNDLSTTIGKVRSTRHFQLWGWVSGHGEPWKLSSEQLDFGQTNVDNIVDCFIEITQTCYTAVLL